MIEKVCKYDKNGTVLTNEKNRYVPLNDGSSEIAEKSIDMLPRTDTIKISPQTSIPSTQATLRVVY